MSEVFAVFLRLGLTSFGGPVAHLAVFRRVFVEQHGWLSEASYADLVALCQSLPGPTSSQVGMAIGRLRAGHAGALAAWLGFTLPSALFMVAAAFAVTHLGAGLQSTAGLLVIAGFQLWAVWVVAQALRAMARSLCPDAWRRITAGVALGLCLIVPGWAGQAAALAAGLGAAMVAPSRRAHDHSEARPLVRGRSLPWLALAMLLLAGLPWWTDAAPLNATVQAGAWVFGGGHVVLPLLHSGLVDAGWIDERAMLAGYGLVQAMPGPLFTISAFVGWLMPAPWGGPAGAALFLVALFAPGALLLQAALPAWQRVRAHPWMATLLPGLNAAVVGLLGAAWVAHVVPAAGQTVLALVQRWGG